MIAAANDADASADAVVTTDRLALCLSGGGFRAALFHLGELEVGHDHLQRGLELYQPEFHRPRVWETGIEPGIFCRCELARTLTMRADVPSAERIPATTEIASDGRPSAAQFPSADWASSPRGPIIATLRRSLRSGSVRFSFFSSTIPSRAAVSDALMCSGASV